MQDDWEDTIRRVYRHEKRRSLYRPRKMWNLRISDELAMDIDATFDSRNWSINVSKEHITWQGIPMVVDHDLPPGCLRFEMKEIR